MEKRKLKLNTISLYTITFFVACILVFLPFYMRGLSKVWKIDGLGQYYPAFLYIGQYIREFLSTGKLQSFDLSIALGEDVFSALNYYGLGDPLNILSVFANKSNGIYIYEFMFYLRLYLSGLAFILYAKYMKLDEKLIVPGAFMYLCSGYMFCACMMYIQFLSPLIYFPLLLWSVEKIFKEKQWWWMALVSLYAALCTMYLFYYAALFLVPYALVRAFFIFGKNIKKIISSCIISGLLAALGTVVSFPVLFPSLKGMLISERAGADVIGTLIKKTYYRPTIENIMKLAKGFLPDYDNGEFFFHEIPVLSYVAVIALIISVVFLKKRSKRNIQLLIVAVVGIGLYMIRITNIIFSGFVEGFSYDRWIFMLEFVFAICFVCVGSDLIKEKFGGKAIAYRTAYGLVIANFAIVGFVLYAFSGKQFTDEFVPAKELIKYVESPVNYSSVVSTDSELYRVSNDSLTGINERPENIQMINGYNGLTFWLSVVNPNTQKIADKLEKLNAGSFVDQRMFGLENSRVAESLAGVKYYFRHDNNDFPAEYELVDTVDFYGEKWEIYKNPDAKPLIYSFDKDYYSEKLEKDYYSDSEEAINQAKSATNVVYNNDSFTCEVDLDTDSVVMLAVPYSDGFSVTIDDIPAKVYNSTIYYMAVDVEKGHHKLEFKYSAYSF